MRELRLVRCGGVRLRDLRDPRDVYVPGADENLSITNSEIARRIRKSPLLRGKPESEISAAIEEALEQQRQLRSKDGAAAGSVPHALSPQVHTRLPVSASEK